MYLDAKYLERLKHVRARPVFKELLYGPGTYEMWDTYLFLKTGTCRLFVSSLQTVSIKHPNFKLHHGNGNGKEVN